MSKLKETNLIIDYMAKTAKTKELGINVDNTVFLADIAKSLAIIADKLCETENKEKK